MGAENDPTQAIDRGPRRAPRGLFAAVSCRRDGAGAPRREREDPRQEGRAHRDPEAARQGAAATRARRSARRSTRSSRRSRPASTTCLRELRSKAARRRARRAAVRSHAARRALPSPRGHRIRSRSCAKRSSTSSASSASPCSTAPRSSTRRTTSRCSASRRITRRRTCRTRFWTTVEATCSARTRRNIQIRAMKSLKPPMAFIAPGTVYRRDDDATHSPMFHQIEAFLVDENVTLAHLKGVLAEFAERLYGPGTPVRLRPSYFPFVEPGAEVDIGCVFCKQPDGTRAGCSLCKHTGWIEILGCGMIHPVVFENCGIDPEQWIGLRARHGPRAHRDASLRHPEHQAALRERSALPRAVLRRNDRDEGLVSTGFASSCPQLTASPQRARRALHRRAGSRSKASTRVRRGRRRVRRRRASSRVRPHPTKSGLRLVTVDRGGGAQQEVVCGAPNVPEPGGLVVLAPLGAHLPAKNMTIAQRAIAGVDERRHALQRGRARPRRRSATGILVLPPGTAEPGTPLVDARARARATPIFEIGLTPNRPDGLGHIGLARELAALYGFPFALAESGAGARRARTRRRSRSRHDRRSRTPSAARTTARRRCVDVTIGAVAALAALPPAGARRALDLERRRRHEPRDARVRPPDARVRSRSRARRASIVVRRAKDGEKLDDARRRRAHARRRRPPHLRRRRARSRSPASWAARPARSSATRSACSSSARTSIRAACVARARRHGMHTESSHRFERGVDPGDVARVLDRRRRAHARRSRRRRRARAHARARCTRRGEPTPPERARVALPRAARRASSSASTSRSRRRSRSSSASAARSRREGRRACDVLVPTHRPDIAREVDLVEEVIRVHGIDTRPRRAPADPRLARRRRARGARAARARRCASRSASPRRSRTLHVARGRSRRSARRRPRCSSRTRSASTTSVMRTTLLPGLLDAVANARRHGERDVREFTDRPGLPRAPKRRRTACPTSASASRVVLAGDRPAWLEKPQPLDVWDAKGFADRDRAAPRGAGAPSRSSRARAKRRRAHLHPRGAAFVERRRRSASARSVRSIPTSSTRSSSTARCSSSRSSSSRSSPGAALPQLRADPALPGEHARHRARREGRHPAPARSRRAVRAAAGPLAEAVRLFDRFVGGQVPAGHASLAFHVVYRAPDRTLTDAEVDAAHANVVKESRRASARRSAG